MMLRPLFGWGSPAGPSARLSILIFHRVLSQADPLFPDEPDQRRFDEVLGWIGRWFRVLPLDKAVAQLAAGTLPARAAAITFDDGYADNATQALPVLQRHGMPATFFIATSFLDGGRMWNDTLIESVRHAADGPVDLTAVGLDIVTLGDLASRRALIHALLKQIKYLEPERRTEAVALVQRSLRANLTEHLMMSTAQVRQLRGAGMQIGAHTCTHPILARTPDADVRREIIASKSALETMLDEPVSLFAYPNGKPGDDYLDKHIAMVREAGFAAAVSTAPGASSAASDPFQLPRFSPWDRTGWRYGARLLNNLRSHGPQPA